MTHLINSATASASSFKAEPIADDVKVAQQQNKTVAINWQKPRPIESELLPVPPFSENHFPKILSDFVMDESDRMACPPDFIAASLIVALGSIIGATCALKPKAFDDTWLVTANLWGAVVGEPASKKTPAISVSMASLARLEAIEAEKLTEKKITYISEMAAFKAHENAIEMEMKKTVSSKGDTKNKYERMQTAKRDLSDLREPEKPYQRRFKTNDTTVEKLGDLLVTNPVGMLIMRDELTGLLASWDKDGHEGDRAFYLESWNGTGNYNIDRISRGSLFVKNLCLSVFGGIQPDLLEKYLSEIVNSLSNDGLIQRFQVLVYPDPTPWVWRDRIPARDPRTAIRNIFNRLSDFDPVQDGAKPADEFVKIPYFVFDKEAQDIFIEWCHELHCSRIANENNPLIRQHLAKYEKLFCSLALIFHLSEGSIGDVDRDSALCAATYCDYLENHARRIYGLVETAKVTAAQTLSRRLRDGKLPDGFTARDVRRKRWGGLSTAHQVEGALDVLEEFSWLQSFELGSGEVGRPTTHYFINPAILAGNPKGN